MNRRDFLKLSALGTLSQFLPKNLLEPTGSTNANDLPNFLIIVFDAWSAKNISLYGYPRETTPNIDRLAEKAIVFHNHYATGPFTAPGTASLLTGLYPWRHRVIHCWDSLSPQDANKNIFSLINEDYYQTAYTHNDCADILLEQARKEMENYIPRREFYLDTDFIFDELLKSDFRAANLARQLSMFRHIQGLQSSLFIQWVYAILREGKLHQYEPLFPLGLPQMGDSAQRFLLEDSVDGLINLSYNWTNPFLGYFHFLPPHAPYNTRKDFADLFLNDGYEPIEKEIHPFSPGTSKESRDLERRQYDEFIRFVDSEFLRIYNSLDSQGLLENTWLILTSDHGESFERGEFHHTTKLLFEPVIKIPLLIFPPNAKQRKDVYAPTSAVDVLPTILSLAQKEIPDWVEGTPLPIGETEESTNKTIYAMNAEENEQYTPIEIGTFMMIHEGYKIMKLIGYPKLQGGEPLIEVYDLTNDPEELDNLAKSNHPIVKELRQMLDEKIRLENQPFQT